MKASKPKLSFSIDSIVGKRKLCDSSASEESCAQDSAVKRHLAQFTPDDKSLSDAMRDRSSVSPRSASSLSNMNHRCTDSASPHGSSSHSPLSLVTGNTHSPNGVTSLPPLQASQFFNRAGFPANSGHSSLSPIPQTQISPNQLAQNTPGLGHPANHSMMMAAAAAAAAASSGSHPFPPMPSDYQQAAAFYPWFMRANPFAGRFPGELLISSAAAASMCVCLFDTSSN